MDPIAAHLNFMPETILVVTAYSVRYNFYKLPSLSSSLLPPGMSVTKAAQDV